MKKIAYFDFCETLVDKQTADSFIKFIIYNECKLVRKILFVFVKSYFYAALAKTKLVPAQKIIIVRLLKGIKSERVEKYAQNYAEDLINRHIIRAVFDELVDKKANGYKIIVVSGGYECYIKYFYPDLVDKVIATKLECKNGVFTGCLDGNDCMGEQKILNITKYLAFIEFIPDYSVAYSDHVSDLPLLKFANDGFVVAKTYNKWIDENKFNYFYVG